VPNWGQVLQQIARENSVSPLAAIDKVRRQYLMKLSRHTGRNVIAYYSGWLNRDPRTAGLSIGDEDMNAFMTAVHGIDRDRGLDLVLHTPGGNLAATESIVNYLRDMFNSDIRAIVPQLAMSAGTMISCATQKIIMGKQSSLGPIDPQFNGISAPGVIDEFNKACEDANNNPSSIPMWQSIIGQYHPTFLGDCKHAIDWAGRMVSDWLQTGMLKDSGKTTEEIDQIVRLLSDHSATKSHSRHIRAEDCKKIGLVVEMMEDDDKLQDLVLTVHHSFMHTFSQTGAIKIVENQKGSAVVLNANPR
jgi:ATP-dependent protease ClpP protease subunit